MALRPLAVKTFLDLTCGISKVLASKFACRSAIVSWDDYGSFFGGQQLIVVSVRVIILCKSIFKYGFAEDTAINDGV